VTYRHAASERTPDLRRCVLFVAGADVAAQERGLAARPDVLVQDLEDFTPPSLKEAARSRTLALCVEARRSHIVAAVRINALSTIGIADLAAVLPAQPQLIFLPKTIEAAEIVTLSREIDRLTGLHGIPHGAIEIVPNIETAAGLTNLRAIVQASPRVKSCLLASEDLAADLDAERSPEALELAYARARFLLEARALGVEPIDAPYTYSDDEGCEREARHARRQGYRSKSAVTPGHVAIINRVFTPGTDEIATARRIVHAFEEARAAGRDRPLVDGLWIEPPAYRNALRLLARAERLESVASAITTDR
jgi:citrate lyase subunit beta / citryl-CoA lyase